MYYFTLRLKPYKIKLYYLGCTIIKRMITTNGKTVVTWGGWKNKQKKSLSRQPQKARKQFVIQFSKHPTVWGIYFNSLCER